MGIRYRVAWRGMRRAHGFAHAAERLAIARCATCGFLCDWPGRRARRGIAFVWAKLGGRGQ